MNRFVWSLILCGSLLLICIQALPRDFNQHDEISVNLAEPEKEDDNNSLTRDENSNITGKVSYSGAQLLKVVVVKNEEKAVVWKLREDKSKYLFLF